MNWIDLLGYTASIFIAISITMKTILRLRIMNLMGAIIMGTYGILIGSLPVIVLNIFICSINIYYLRKLMKEKEKLNSL